MCQRDLARTRWHCPLALIAHSNGARAGTAVAPHVSDSGDSPSSQWALAPEPVQY
jgi:hypothetical protein